MATLPLGIAVRQISVLAAEPTPRPSKNAVRHRRITRSESACSCCQRRPLRGGQNVRRLLVCDDCFSVQVVTRGVHTQRAASLAAVGRRTVYAADVARFALSALSWQIFGSNQESALYPGRTSGSWQRSGIGGNRSGRPSARCCTASLYCGGEIPILGPAEPLGPAARRGVLAETG